MPEPPRRSVWAALALVTAGALALRLPYLGNQSLWYDETFTRTIAAAPSVTRLWHEVKATEGTPPPLPRRAAGRGRRALDPLLRRVRGGRRGRPPPLAAPGGAPAHARLERRRCGARRTAHPCALGADRCPHRLHRVARAGRPDRAGGSPAGHGAQRAARLARGHRPRPGGRRAGGRAAYGPPFGAARGHRAARRDHDRTAAAPVADRHRGPAAGAQHADRLALPGGARRSGPPPPARAAARPLRRRGRGRGRVGGK